MEGRAPNPDTDVKTIYGGGEVTSWCGARHLQTGGAAGKLVLSIDHKETVNSRRGQVVGLTTAVLNGRQVKKERWPPLGDMGWERKLAFKQQFDD